MTRPSGFDAESDSGTREPMDRLDAEADEHEQWLRENVPPHHG